MQECSYVLVPADINEPVQELQIKLPEGKEVEAFLDKLKQHFGISGGNKTAEQRQAQKEALIKQVGDEAARNLSDDIWETALNMNMVENISLLGNSPETGFVGINMYCDDEGAIKGAPHNVRASEIAHCCGKLLEVRGDAFLGRIFDNEDDFKRLDFRASEVSSSAAWVVQAAQIARRKAAEESAEARLERISRGANPSSRGGSAKVEEVTPAEEARLKGNAAVAKGQWEEAVACYSAAIKLDSSMLTAVNNRALAYLKLSQRDAALADCNTVLASEPGNVKALLRRATAQKELNGYQEAVADVRAVLAVEPSNQAAVRLMEELQGGAGVAAGGTGHTASGEQCEGQ